MASLTVAGRGQYTTILDLDYASARVALVEPGVELRLQGLELRNGRARTGFGVDLLDQSAAGTRVVLHDVAAFTFACLPLDLFLAAALATARPPDLPYGAFGRPQQAERGSTWCRTTPAVAACYNTTLFATDVALSISPQVLPGVYGSGGYVLWGLNTSLADSSHGGSVYLRSRTDASDASAGATVYGSSVATGGGAAADVALRIANSGGGGDSSSATRAAANSAAAAAWLQSLQGRSLVPVGDIWIGTGGRWALEPNSILGGGSFGKVFRGAWRGRQVAVKVLSYDSEVATAVHNEAMLSMTLRHPNIVAALHWLCIAADGGARGCSSGSVAALAAAALSATASDAPEQALPSAGSSHGFLVMELCEGGSLGAWRRSAWREAGDLPDLSLLLPWALDIARGMAFLHAVGVCHGDLKLNNVMLSRSNGPASSSTPLASHSAPYTPFVTPHARRAAVPVPPAAAGTMSSDAALVSPHVSAALPLAAPPTGTPGPGLSDGPWRPITPASCSEQPPTGSGTGTSWLDPGGAAGASSARLEALSPSEPRPTPAAGPGAGLANRWVAKVGDFGLARVLGADASHVSTRPHGTSSHLAPEVWAEGHLSQQADVYAFGVTLWELATGEKPWRGLRAGRILHAVMLRGSRPPLPPWLPPAYAAIVQACWAQAPRDRPSFAAIVEQLEALAASTAAAATPPQSASVGAGPGGGGTPRSAAAQEAPGGAAAAAAATAAAAAADLLARAAVIRVTPQK
ncbi:hypothetical protein GPECTOR_13g632 [Gonium pectorale]|uniref:Protein kinase domain-containing protein n=1 Tax=Gonium pectorale TaxID=33097 RepID=A0A150GMZ1_GONPE|nr:hypothetical protein GPECTOR_13g632 [Gonium pectorale]|eukprot:KXZ51145.1 hypothetical protein GPECTOR_13g632 [Gonium pectorale]